MPGLILPVAIDRQAKLSRLSRITMAMSTLFFVMLACFPAISWGHAFPDHSDPKVGSTVAVSPERVRIWFDGDLEPAFSTLVVRNSGGVTVDKKDTRVNPSDARLLEVSVPKLPPGIYKVIWNIVSRDGHRTNGDYTFTVKQGN